MAVTSFPIFVLPPYLLIGFYLLLRIGHDRSTLAAIRNPFQIDDLKGRLHLAASLFGYQPIKEDLHKTIEITIDFFFTLVYQPIQLKSP
jgi:hypothetical protein